MLALLRRAARTLISSTVLTSALFLLCVSASADTTLELKNDFIEAFKNRATIEATYSVKFSHAKPKTPSPGKPSNDGDIHISGTAPEVGLLTVAEIMNAKDFLNVVKFVHDRAGSNVAIAMTGVWRIWPEHGGDSVHVQGEADPAEITDTNPDHVFEIHPLTKVGSFDVSGTFHPIPGFRTKDAQSAFQNYEGARSKIVPDGTTTRIRMSQATYHQVDVYGVKQTTRLASAQRRTAQSLRHGAQAVTAADNDGRRCAGHCRRAS
jgi:hypothetical protein